MAVQFFTGPRAAERIAAAHRFLDGAAGRGGAGRPGAGGAKGRGGARRLGFTVLGGVDYAARVFCRERAARDGALVGAAARGLDSLALELAKPELAAAGLRGPSRAAELAVVTQVVHDAGKRGGLDRFSRVAEGPGLARRLHHTFSEFRAAGISPARVAAADATLGRLYRESAGQLERAGFADRCRVLEAAARRLEAGGGPIPRRPLVLLDPKLGEPLMRGLVSRLAERAAEVFVTCPDADRATVAAIEAMGGRAAEAPGGGSSSGREGEAVVSAVQRRLFRAGADPPGRRSGRRVEDGLSVIGAPGPAAEALEIARVFLREAGGGVRFDRMAVLVDDPAAYVPALAEAFGRAAVPVFFEIGAEPPSRAGRAFLALLNTALGGLSAEAFLEFLSLDADRRGAGPDGDEGEEAGDAGRSAVPGGDGDEPAGGEPAEAGDEASAAVRLREQLVLEAGVIGGLDRWERRLERLASRLADEEREADRAGEADGARERRRRREELARLQAEALPLLRRLSKLPGEATLGQWVEALGGLARAALRDPGPVLAALGATAPMAEFGPLTLAEVRRELAGRLLDARGRSPGERQGRVLVAPIGGARGLAFEVVAIPGLSEGAFRSGLREDPILPDRLRREFGDDLATGPDRLESVRLRLSLAVGAAVRRLVLSYSSLDVVEGRPQVPSYYFAEALRAALGKTPTLDGIADLAGRESAVRRGLRAPKRPEWALDRREFDLASISRALSPEEDAPDGESPRPGESAEGAAAYLLRDERLAAALRQEYMRDSRAWQPADGFLRPGPEAAAALGRHRPTARAYSATGLEAYAKCPYRFYLKNIVRLRPVERPAPLTQVDALTRGSLVHEVFFALGQRMRKLGMTPLPAERLDEALRLLDEVFEPVAASFREEAAPEIERIWNDQMDGLRSDFRGYLEREADSGWQVVANELTFGMAPVGPADPASRREPAVLPGGLRLRGSIDAVEEAADGTRRVTDYKSGRISVRPSEDRHTLFGGEALQPVLYAFAQEALTGKPTQVGRLYYTTLRGQYHQTLVSTGTPEARGLLLRFTDFLERAVAEGRFPAAPNSNPRFSECGYCDYRSICGPGPAAHAERKNPEGRALAEVREVRALP